MLHRIISLVLLSAGSVALADRPRHDQPRPVIDVTVSGVIANKGTNTRAIAGENRGAYLAIERVFDGQMTSQVWVDQVQYMGRSQPLASFSNLRFSYFDTHELAFEALFLPNTTEVLCKSAFQYGNKKITSVATTCGPARAITPLPPVQPPIQPPVQPPIQPPVQPPIVPMPVVPSRPVANLTELGNLCQQAFSFQSDRTACVEQARILVEETPYAASVKTVIAECGRFTFTGDRTKCMIAATRMTREPGDTIRFCINSASFTTDRLTCLNNYTTRNPR